MILSYGCYGDLRPASLTVTLMCNALHLQGSSELNETYEEEEEEEEEELDDEDDDDEPVG